MAPNESRQMEMLLQEGGIADDGTTRDPVSGNEVPPGSMAEEVRDDIPAQLSEGEYVVPADVVRFYGVRFFEDLRGQAKEGLMDMERNGRIGGEPVAQTMDNQTGNDLTPEELAALNEITGMAMGGVVPPVNPYLQQQQMYQQPVASNTIYASDGVDVSEGSGVDPYKPQFTSETAAAFGPGFLIDQTLGRLPTTDSDIKTVTLYSPDGAVAMVTLPAQQERYDALIAMGYSEEPVVLSTDTAVGVTDEDDRGPAQDTTEPLGGQAAIANAEAQGLDTGSSIAANIANFGKDAVAGVINGSILGLAVNAITGKTVSEHLGITGDDDGDTGGIFGGLNDISGDGKTSFADTALGDLLGFDGKLGVQGPSIGESIAGGRRGGDDDGGRQPAGGGAPQGEGQGDDASANAAGGANASGPSASTAGPSGNAGESEAATGGVGDVGLGSGPMGLNEGGMVKRPKKSKKK